MSNITGKIVLITGASSGIGEATARLLAAQGATVVLGARRLERLEKLVAEIGERGGVAAYRALDVTSREDTQAFVDFAEQRFGRVDVIINNAGVMPLSPLDALKIARQNPDRHVVFFAIGFETTAPSTAMTILQARREDINNFSLFCNHILIIPVLKALLDSPDMKLDGFVGPGHVSTVIGTRPYEFVPREYGKPVVVSGFEPLDVVQSVYMVIKQIVEGRAEVENQYKRVVRPEGNMKALEVICEVFEPRDYFEWRGLGSIPRSGLKIKKKYAAFDAELKFEVPGLKIADPKACQCGEILKGVLKPWECKVFGTACTPETPIGSCMVSSEGACAAYYNYGRLSKVAQTWV